MKKQHIAAAACLVAGAIGFAAVYSTQKIGKEEVPTEISQTSNIVEPTETEKPKPVETEKEQPSEKKETKQETVAEETVLHFDPQAITNWPIKGDVLLPFSMEKTIYFPTLDQYQYNRGMVIRADEGADVSAVTAGKIIDIYDSAETGHTVVQDLGDGYTAIYGQLRDLNYDEGDTIAAGDVIGSVSATSKYFTVEGNNVYFAMEQDGKPINPMDYFGNL